MRFGGDGAGRGRRAGAVAAPGRRAGAERLGRGRGARGRRAPRAAPRGRGRRRSRASPGSSPTSCAPRAARSTRRSTASRPWTSRSASARARRQRHPDARASTASRSAAPCAATSRCATCPVILLSWKEDLLQRVRELGASAAAYMKKESDSRAILARVREVLRPRAQRGAHRDAPAGRRRGARPPRRAHRRASSSSWPARCVRGRADGRARRDVPLRDRDSAAAAPARRHAHGERRQLPERRARRVPACSAWAPGGSSSRRASEPIRGELAGTPRRPARAAPRRGPRRARRRRRARAR